MTRVEIGPREVSGMVQTLHDRFAEMAEQPCTENDVELFLKQLRGLKSFVETLEDISETRRQHLENLKPRLVDVPKLTVEALCDPKVYQFPVVAASPPLETKNKE
ncbi:hypothetical protein TRICHSKD4_2269 [Roseibium sp. TrichSKD4]|uniref:hypothetical protein n=1 Tax=Roseibium sp. TrichSKD4 TaxID=744980 RepID=UPI0001E56936|nr:hypothetical protein [Roseibium sp. TrichSKD4]EFO32470.1 hypothetical protein TRICHSKD4_2269 [Roseibium sp. TrichSKD4]